MARLATGSLYTNGYACIYGLLNSQRVIASGVFPYFPSNRPVYPLLVLESKNSEENFKSFGLQSRGLGFNFQISCLAESNKQMDELVNEVDSILINNRAAAMASGLSSLKINVSDSAHTELNGKLIHFKVMNANYSWKGDSQ